MLSIYVASLNSAYDLAEIKMQDVDISQTPQMHVKVRNKYVRTCNNCVKLLIEEK